MVSNMRSDLTDKGSSIGFLNFCISIRLATFYLYG